MSKMYSKIIYTLFLIVCLSGCSFVNKETKSENENEIKLEFEQAKSSEIESEMDFSPGDLYIMFEEMNNEQIENFLYDDYNKDGIHEAFVVTKDMNEYKLWYMSPSDCKIVTDNLENVDNLNTAILSFEIKDYLLLQQIVDGRKNTLVYTLNNDNKVIQSNISGKGYIRHTATGDIFLDVYETADDNNQIEEQEYITYYLYYIYDAGFREYGAIPIGQEQFLKFEGAQDILDGIYEKYPDTQLEISYLYRANHYININIAVYGDNAIEYRHITLSYDEKKVECISEEVNKGKVETAHILGIATFPTAFKEPQNN
ncbi:MAG: hypothetical protein IJD40_10405 [Lachnospiraceae bacterium]|nr:hypothetical protein [Lachnospiraceae bacterium]